jgi:toxin ParE1/3/4
VKIGWSTAAKRDLGRIRTYIAKDNPYAAAHVAKAILDASERLALLPNRGRMSEKTGVRLLQVVGLPYVISYRVIDDVEILNVFDQRRNPEDMF